MEKLNDIPIRYLKGIGPKRAISFQKLGIVSIEDLLYYFPRRYEDRSVFSSIKDVKEGEVYTIKAELLAKGGRRSFRRRGFSIVEAAVSDSTGVLYCVWFNQAYLHDVFSAGQQLILHGKVERYGSRLQMSAPEFELVNEEEGGSLSMGRVVPVYRIPAGITQRYFRTIVKRCLDEYLPKMNDFLPYDIRARHKLLNLAKSLINIHFPENIAVQRESYRRLAFEEFLLFQIPLVIRKLRRRKKPGIAHVIDGALKDAFIKGLPFQLTAAQKKVLAEISADMSHPAAMQRLLQGDVGSGKTVVATIASLMAVQGGYQVAFMVPTEILAKQHYEKIKVQAAGCKSSARPVTIKLLTSSIAKEERKSIIKEIEKGRVDLVIGTHALLEEEVVFKSLSLVVIDEQHKFGVGQRALLPKKGLNPDLLIMTATPIPRTLAITLYGDLDVSVINELPPGRQAIKTTHFTEAESQDAYTIVKGQAALGRQAYIVYPVIEESYALDISGAKKMCAEFRKKEFKKYRVGLIHGKLSQKEQDDIMSRFVSRQLDILVSTTILEVGIDVANATCMVIQNAERFGLSQLHQLRGRVGRGAEQSFCLLISDAKTIDAEARIKAMVAYSDGFRIAEEDLKIRGPGEFFGSRQHGLTELRIANPLTQMQLLKAAREEAYKLTSADEELAQRQNTLLKEKLLQRFPEYRTFSTAG